MRLLCESCVCSAPIVLMVLGFGDQQRCACVVYRGDSCGSRCILKVWRLRHFSVFPSGITCELRRRPSTSSVSWEKWGRPDQDSPTSEILHSFNNRHLIAHTGLHTHQSLSFDRQRHAIVDSATHTIVQRVLVTLRRAQSSLGPENLFQVGVLGF